MILRSSKKIAITLLEITVVILIIAVLAALLVPALNRSREQAKASLCANNMRQLLAGRQSYVVENDGGTIPALTTWSGAACTWRWYLNQKYEIPTKVFRCPSAPGIQHDAAESDLDSNYAALGDDPWKNGVAVASIEHGSQQLVLLETRGPLCVLSQNDCKGAPPMSDGKGIIGFWHNYKTTCGIRRRQIGPHKGVKLCTAAYRAIINSLPRLTRCRRG